MERNMRIDITKQDGAILLYALQLLLDKQWDGGYAESEIITTRELAETVFDAILQGD
jgi:hypothetical protein